MSQIKNHIIQTLKEVSDLWEIPKKYFVELEVTTNMEDFHMKAKFLILTYKMYYFKIYEEVVTILEKIFSEDDIKDVNDHKSVSNLIIKREIISCYMLGENPEHNEIILKLTQ